MKLGWNPKDAARFAPWLELFSNQPLKRFQQWRKYPAPKSYTPRKWHASELHSTHSHLQHQIYEQVFYEHKRAGGAVSGYFTYSIKGTKSWVKELSLWLQGNEKDHDQDVEKFIYMANCLNISATGSSLPSSIRQLIADKNSKTQDWSYKDVYVDDSGHGYNFSNYNAASARETWARQYLLRINSPDRTKALIERKIEFEKAGKVYASFDPEAWGVK